jgi:hypothetical protein
MLRRLILLALAVCALAAGGAAAAKGPKPRLASSIGRPLVGLPKTVTVKTRVGGAAAIWIRGPAAARTFRARRVAGGRVRARVTFPSLGRWTIGVRLGSRSWRLATVEPRGAGVSVREPFGLSVAPDGALLLADRAGGQILRVDPVTGLRTVVASGFDQPIAMAFDRDERLHVADTGGIYRVDAGGRVRVAGNGTRGHTGDGGPATAASLAGHGGFTFLPDGRMAIAEYDGWVRVVGTDGTIDTLAGNGTEGYAGDGGPAKAAVVRHPHDVEALADGTLLVADSHNGAIRAIGPDGRIRTVVASLSAPVDLAAAPGGGFVIGDAAGTVYRIAADGARQVALRAQRGLRITAAVTVDGAGRVYAGDFEAGIVLRAEPGGDVTRVVG